MLVTCTHSKLLRATAVTLAYRLSDEELSLPYMSQALNWSFEPVSDDADFIRTSYIGYFGQRVSLSTIYKSIKVVQFHGILLRKLMGFFRSTGADLEEAVNHLQKRITNRFWFNEQNEFVLGLVSSAKAALRLSRECTWAGAFDRPRLLTRLYDHCRIVADESHLTGWKRRAA